MTPSLNENLITTKDAGELSGYNPDYLARLARSGKISGKRIGHSWLIERESLDQFLGQQGDRKIDYARALARARTEEYQANRAPLRRVVRTLARPVQSPQISPLTTLVESSFRSHAVALAVALLVVGTGAVGARAAAISQLAGATASLMREVAYGFDAAFGGTTSGIRAKFAEVNDAMRAERARVAENNLATSARLASPEILAFDLEATRMVLTSEPRAHVASRFESRTLSASANTSIVTSDDLKTFARDTYALATHPSRIVSTVGTSAYGAIGAALAGYRTLLEQSGVRALALGVATRDALSRAPAASARLSAQTVLALGQGVIDATHALIAADVSLAYSTAAAAPASARATVALIGSTGDVLAGATARVPALAAAAFLHTTEIPARVAPAIAETVFEAEYAAATRFVPLAHALSRQYLALVLGTGRLTYTATDHTLALAASAGARLPQTFSQPWKSDFHTVGIAIEDAYLGALGKTAAAIEYGISNIENRIDHVPQVAAALAAVGPALSAGERVALSTYETLHGFFISTTSALAAFFSTTPPLVLPTGVPKARVITVATSAKPTPYNLPPTTSNSYPTYTTINGVSLDYVSQSLDTMRNNILATVAGMIQPVAYQTAGNSTTIQYVSMMQDLSGITIRDGSFRGGTFDGGTVSNGISVSATAGTFGSLVATNANFTSLTAGATSLATTTITGSLAVGTSSPWGNGLLTVGTSTPLLHISSNTGNIGIGTSVPVAPLQVNGGVFTPLGGVIGTTVFSQYSGIGTSGIITQGDGQTTGGGIFVATGDNQWSSNL
ncbi:MAG: helix-turn-helix domain-containing protein, partial [Candidatus Paceibacterota bacterium]